ncbi:MAG: protease modulator HflK, partial [Candidatus Methylopumilus sp.]
MAKNPEQNNNQDQGPPDLDELLNDLGKKIGRLFGRKESTQKNSRPNNESSQSKTPQDQLPVTTIVLIIALIWAATGFYIVDQGSRGVVLRFGKNTEVTMPGPRWHIPFPVESVEVVNLEQVRTLEVGYRSSGNSVARSKELRESL